MSYDGSESLSIATVLEIADAKNVEPPELDITVADHIDTDAIDQLGDHETAAWTLTFELPENTVTVTSDGVVRVDGHRRGTEQFQYRRKDT